VALLSGFQPVGGDNFEILTFASVSGGFASYSGLNIGNGFVLDPVFFATSLWLITSAV
jgi:hypothetical protein